MFDLGVKFVCFFSVFFGLSMFPTICFTAFCLFGKFFFFGGKENNDKFLFCERIGKKKGEKSKRETGGLHFFGKFGNSCEISLDSCLYCKKKEKRQRKLDTIWFRNLEKLSLLRTLFGFAKKKE